MEQRSNDAAVNGVQTMLKKEECAFDMVLRLRPSVVVVEDEQL
jgi:hypothetical protein